MPRHGTLRGVGLTASGAVVVAGSFAALGLPPDGIARYYRDTLTPAGFAIWFCGFVAATLAPPSIAVICCFGAMQIGRAHVCTPVTNAQIVFRLLLEKKKYNNDNN